MGYLESNLAMFNQISVINTALLSFTNDCNGSYAY